MNTKKKHLWILSLVTAVLLSANCVVQADEYYAGGVTVDIDRVINGYLWIEDATVNLYKNAHIKNDIFFGEVWSLSGSVLNIYGGTIDSYLWLTSSSNGLPEAQVTVYGYGFAVGGVPVAEGTPEVFIPNKQLSGFYADGTPFAFMVDCYTEGGFYLTVKLGWILSKPEMAVAPASVDYGQLKVGQSLAKTVSVVNNGNANFTLQTVSLTEDSSPGFSVKPMTQLPLTIEPAQTVDVEVVFAPAAKGAATGVLRITGDDANNPVVQVALAGEGIVPVMVVDPAALDFGELKVGETAAGTISIANNGQAELIVNSIGLAEGGSADFKVASVATPFAVAVGTTAEIEVTYTPAAAGNASAVLKITGDDPNNTTAGVALSASAVNPVQTPLEQINAIIAFFDNGVKAQTIVGVGPNKNCKRAHIDAIRQMLLCTKCLIKYEYNRWAIYALYDISQKADGKKCPTDFIEGSAVEELNTKIKTLIDTLKAK